MTEANLSLVEREEGGVTVLEVAGEVDLYTAPELRSRILKLVEGKRPRLIVDLDRVGFMDSSGLGTLVSCLKRIRERDGDLSLVVGEGSVKKVLTITGMDRAFSVHDRVSDALRT